MDKLEISLENERLRYQLDWIIDRASENTNDLNFPPVNLYLYIFECV